VQQQQQQQQQKQQQEQQEMVMMLSLQRQQSPATECSALMTVLQPSMMQGSCQLARSTAFASWYGQSHCNTVELLWLLVIASQLQTLERDQVPPFRPKCWHMKAAAMMMDVVCPAYQHARLVCLNK
jgi:hypothetical protein